MISVLMVIGLGHVIIVLTVRLRSRGTCPKVKATNATQHLSEVKANVTWKLSES